MKRLFSLPVILLSAAGVAFGVLHSAASLYEIGLQVIGVVGYLVPIIVVGTVLELLAKRKPGFSVPRECVVLAVLFLVLFSIIVYLAPEMGQRGMAYDSWRAQKSLEAGRITHVHAAIHTYWVNYELLLSALGMLISAKLQVGQLLNVGCRVLTIAVFFLLVSKCFGRRIARFSTLLLGFSPVCTFYALTLVGDFLAALFFLLSLYLLVNASADHVPPKRSIVLSVIAGVSLGMGLLFKAIIFIMVPAFLVGAVAHLMLIRDAKQMKSGLKALVLLVVSCWLFGIVVQGGCRAYRDGGNESSEACGLRGEMLYAMRLGLDVSHGGYYSPAVAKRFRTLNTAERYAEVQDMLSRTYKKLPDFLVKKYCSIWGRDDAPGGVLYWFDATCRKDPLHQKGPVLRPDWIMQYMRCEHLVLAFLFLAGAGGLALSTRRQSPIRLLPGYVGIAVILLFAMMEMLIESHGRYRMVVYPFYFLVLPYSSIWLSRDNPVYEWMRIHVIK